STAKVLRIDFDISMGNIDVLQGVSSNKTISDLFDKGIPLNEMINFAPSGVDYVSGGSGLNTIFNLEKYKRDIFFKQYDKLEQEYDYIIFDMRAGVSENR